MTIDVACNDPDNGNFAGVAMQLQIGCAEFEANAWANSSYRLIGPKFELVPGGFKMSGKGFKIAGSKDWYGNWCWNRYQMEDGEITRFVQWIWKRFNFSCTTATEEFFDWFDHAEIKTDDRVAAMIKNLHT